MRIAPARPPFASLAETRQDAVSSVSRTRSVRPPHPVATPAHAALWAAERGSISFLFEKRMPIAEGVGPSLSRWAHSLTPRSLPARARGTARRRDPARARPGDEAR